MNIKSISFSNYKIFEKEQTIDLKPITIFLGKNSAGKSSLLKLPILLLNSFSNLGSNGNLLELAPHGLDLAYEFKDLLYNKFETRVLRFKLDVESEGVIYFLKIGIQNIPELSIQIISEFNFSSTSKDVNIDLKGIIDRHNNYYYSGHFNQFELTRVNINFKNLLPQSTTVDKPDFVKHLNEFFHKYSPLFIFLSDKIRYLKPFRAFPERIFENRRNMDFGNDFDGSETPYLLFNNKELLNNVKDWYSKILNIENIELIATDRRKKFFELNIISKQSPTTPINIFDVGQGISQSLPVVTRAFLPRTGIIEIIEQPELHLHQSAHGDIASLLVESANNNKDSIYIIETHSENFILRIRRLIAEGTISKDDVNLLWIENRENSASIKPIKIDDMGEVDFWPEGIFSEAFEEAKAIRKAQRTKN